MNRPIVLDMETFFWDSDAYEQNSSKYLSFFAHLSEFLQWLRPGRPLSGDQDIPNNIPLVCSDELWQQIYLEVCEGFIKEKVEQPGANLIMQCLSMIYGDLYSLSFDSESYAVTSTPNIKKTHFNAVVIEQLDLISAAIH